MLALLESIGITLETLHKAVTATTLYVKLGNNRAHACCAAVLHLLRPFTRAGLLGGHCEKSDSCKTEILPGLVVIVDLLFELALQLVL